jgi:hypothetical protein
MRTTKATTAALAVCALALAACASVEPPPLPRTELLAEAPERPYESVGRIAARGEPGMHRRLVYEALRRKADALGADAVLKLEERTLQQRAPAPYDPPQRPLLGNAYPGPLQSFDPGAFPPEGAQLRVRGPYFVVEGLAIRYK